MTETLPGFELLVTPHTAPEPEKLSADRRRALRQLPLPRAHRPPRPHLPQVHHRRRLPHQLLIGERRPGVVARLLRPRVGRPEAVTRRSTKRAVMTAHVVTVYAPTITVDPPEWTLAAACQFVDAEIFFPERGGSTREAKMVCASCPVQADCLADALAHQDRFGIWGGLSEHERRQLLPPGSGRGRTRTPKPIQHGTYGGYTTHRRRDESPCGSCHDAAKRVWLARKQRRRSA